MNFLGSVYEVTLFVTVKTPTHINGNLFFRQQCNIPDTLDVFYEPVLVDDFKKWLHNISNVTSIYKYPMNCMTVLLNNR